MCYGGGGWECVPLSSECGKVEAEGKTGLPGKVVPYSSEHRWEGELRHQPSACTETFLMGQILPSAVGFI